jgi:hypothetical protein
VECCTPCCQPACGQCNSCSSPPVGLPSAPVLH